MLTFCRKIGQKIFIGDGPTPIVITVLDIQGARVRLGIEAPKGTKIDREEVRKQKESAKCDNTK